MKRIKWRKLGTRESTLLDRYLRTVGYKKMFGRRSGMRIRNLLDVSQNKIFDHWIDTDEEKKNHKTLMEEFRNGKWRPLFEYAKQVLEKLLSKYSNPIYENKTFKKVILISLFKNFCKDYSLSRPIFYYTHFASPLLENRFKLILKRKKISTDFLWYYIKNYLFNYLSNNLKIFFPVKRIKIKFRKEMLKKFNKKEKEILDFIAWNACLHEISERISNWLFERFKNVFSTISQELKINLDDLFFYLPEEIIKAFKNRALPKYIIESRKQFYILLLGNGKIKLQTEKENLRQFNIPVGRNRQKNYIVGATAYPGKMIGTVKIIKTIADIKQLSKDNIIVTSMTTPRMVPFLKKAEAIVTDEGGITCHAAIVSRELKIPCIVGTKIATKVLKDGDFVEVDANKRIVKIIKR